MTNKQIHVMVVEDNPGDALLLREALAVAGYHDFTVTVTERLEQALAELDQATCDVVLLDLSLPDSQGIDTFLKFRTQCQDVPVIVITGLADEELAMTVVRAGAQDYLVKGQWDQNLLVRTIRYSIERRKTETELRQVNRALKVISECNQVMVRAVDENELLAATCRNLVEVGGYRMAWVGYAQADQAKSVRPVAHAGCEYGYLESAGITWADEPRGQGPTGTAIRTGRYQIGRDFQKDPRMAPWREQALQRGFQSSIALPLTSDGKTFGALTVYAYHAEAFHEAEIALLLEMAEDLAFGIRSLRTRRERDRAVEHIVATNDLLELFTRKATLQAYLDAVVRLIRKWSGCACVGIRLIDADRHAPYAAHVGFDRAFWEKENCLHLDRDRCICTRVMRETRAAQERPCLTGGGSFVCNDTGQLVATMTPADQKRYRGECLRAGFLTLAIIPLYYREQVLGAIHLADRSKDRLPPEEIRFLESTALLIGEAVHRFSMEKALQESKELLERMFNTTHILIAYLDTRFNFIRVNRAYAQAEGRTPAFFVGKNHFDLHPNPDNERIFHAVVKTGQPHHVLAKPFHHEKDPERDVTYWDWSLEPVKEPDGKVSGIVLSLLNVTEQKRLESELLEISRREQRRIGQDLHDVLGQNLTGLAFLVKVLERKLTERALPEAQDAAKLAQMTNQAIVLTRALARGINPVEVKADGLMMALQEFTANIEQVFNVSCRFQYDSPILIQDNDAAIHLYHIVQEAINNAIKHGKARNIHVRLADSGGQVNLCVKDDGVGLPENPGKNRGMGLQIMNYRAKMIGASFRAERDAGGGTIIECSFKNSTERA